MDLDYDAMTAELMAAIEAGEVTSDQDSLNAWVGEYVMNMVDAIEPSEKTIELTYVKGDDGWSLDESSNTEASMIFV